jgi:hypothetical protein
MKKFTLFSIFVFLTMSITDISFSQVNTAPLSSEEKEVVKPLG